MFKLRPTVICCVIMCASVAVAVIPSSGNHTVANTQVSQNTYDKGCCVGLRGNVDNDPTDAVSLGDLTVLIDILFVSFVDPVCWEESNLDGSTPEGPGSVSLGDLTVLIDILFVSFNDPAPCPVETVTDIDGNVYQTVVIGDQVWMAQNLKVTHYRNGDLIPHVTDNGDWAGLTTGAYCIYDNVIGNVFPYGRLYNWYAVNDSRNLAPAGWHVPTDAEWKQMEMYLGMSQVTADSTGQRGTNEGGKLKATGAELWHSPNEGATNESGFSGLPGGARSVAGDFINLSWYAYFWSSTEFDGTDAWYRELAYYHPKVRRQDVGKEVGYSIRCVKDLVVTDIDGNEYQTVTIGDQVWMAENLKVTHYRNGDPISHVTDDGEWAGLTTGAYCEFDNDSGNVAVHGRMYNWYAVDDSRNIAPAGWHVPTDDEWKQLEMYLGMSQAEADDTGQRGWPVGGELKEAGTTHWSAPNTGATNESGFTALPGGYRGLNGLFYNRQSTAYLWSSTESFSGFAWRRLLDHISAYVDRNAGREYYGFSVRCLRD